MAVSASNVQDSLGFGLFSGEKRHQSWFIDLLNFQVIEATLSEAIASQTIQFVIVCENKAKSKATDNFLCLNVSEDEFWDLNLVKKQVVSQPLLLRLNLVVLCSSTAVHVAVLYLTTFVPVTTRVCWNPHPIALIFLESIASTLRKHLSLLTQFPKSVTTNL